jgi:acetyl-CoA carboxylase biotin carboxylase subunit
MSTLQRVLVANRGEIALRVVRACHQLGLEAVAVYSDADAEAVHVQRADAAYHLGPSPAGKSYLNAEALLAAAKQSGADAVHPGYGFLSENAEFAEAVTDAGLTFVGPSGEAIAAMGDKARARSLAREAGVPLVPGSDLVTGPDEAAATAGQVGYPVLVKAAAGGGGRGIRIAADGAELAAVLPTARREAGAAFGSDGVYLEKYLARPRHVEIQVLGDAHGTVVHCYERECSLQRRRQKLFEEAPSPGLPPGLRGEMTTAAVRLAQAAGYTGAGTVEFLVAGEEFFFIEMNTRIQVEHPITELVTGLDLVACQLRVAAGEPLPMGQDDIGLGGHAVECRINAEDPDHGFAPSPGGIEALDIPGGPGVRVEHALTAGGAVVPFYDSLVAKLCAWGQDRDQALARARQALTELRIDGITTTAGLHQRLLDTPQLQSGNYDTAWLEEYLT